MAPHGESACHKDATEEGWQPLTSPRGDAMNETTTTAREGIQTLGKVCAEPVGWDAAEPMPAEYALACMEPTQARMRVCHVRGVCRM